MTRFLRAASNIFAVLAIVGALSSFLDAPSEATSAAGAAAFRCRRAERGTNIDLVRRIEIASSRLGVDSSCRVRQRSVEICEPAELTLHVSDGGLIAYEPPVSVATRACAKVACTPEGSERLLELEDSLGRRVGSTRRVVEVCVPLLDGFEQR